MALHIFFAQQHTTGEKRKAACSVDLALETDLFSYMSSAGENFIGLAGANERPTPNQIQDFEEAFEQLKRLSMHQEQVKEAERARIAREIHDELGSSLTALKMGIDCLKRDFAVGNKALEKKTIEIDGLILGMIESVQRIARDLRPRLLDDLGLDAAIDWQTREFEKRTDIKCSLDIENSFPAILPNDVSTAVFRVYQETLTNVSRHAVATELAVYFSITPEALTLTVQDNGVGITPEQAAGNRSFGIMGMRERIALWGGHFEIWGESGKGTRISVGIPLLTTDR